MTFPSPAIRAATRKSAEYVHLCLARDLHGYVCTLALVHDDEHQACGDDGKTWVRWPRAWREKAIRDSRSMVPPPDPPTPPESPRAPSRVAQDSARRLAIHRAYVYGEDGHLPLEVKLHDSDWVEP